MIREFFRQTVSLPAWGWLMVLAGVFGNGWVVGWVMKSQVEIRAQREIRLQQQRIHIDPDPVDKGILPPDWES